MDPQVKKITLIEPVAQVELELEVLGCYSLPESWKSGEIETVEYTYNINFLGIQVLNGKLRRRELTEEEIKVAEEAKKGKKEPPKKKGQEAELEIQEEKKKAEELTRRGSQSSRYDDEANFYMTKEDLYKSPCVAWEQESMSDTRVVKSYPVSVQIEEMKMLDLLENINDSGVYLDFSRVPKAQEEESKKKPVKGKPQEEAKSSYYKAWVSLSAFREYGITEQHLRVKLEDAEGEEAVHAKTYLSLKLKLSTAIYPPPPPHITLPKHLIPIKPPPPKFLPSKDGTHDFQRQIKLACKAIAAEFHNMFSEQLADSSATPQRQKELRDSRKEEFLYYFNTSGKSQILKNKLRKSVVKICREKHKGVNSLKGLSFSEKDKVYSELYAYLLASMQESLVEVTQEKKEILHEEPILPFDLAEGEKQEAACEILGETYDQKLRRLAMESEVKGDVEKACKYLNDRTERNPLDKEVWVDFTRFMLRQYNLQGAEKYMSEVISLSEDWTRDQYLLMACIFLSRKKYHESLVFFNQLLLHDPEDIFIILLISLTYNLLNKSALEKFYISKAKRLCMIHLNLAGAKSHQISVLANITLRHEEGKSITPDTLDDLYFSLIEYLMSQKLSDLSRLALKKIANRDSNLAKFKYISAEIEFWSRQYENCNTLLEELLKTEPRHNLAWGLKAESCYSSRRYIEAQECFLKALRYSAGSSPSILLKLGSIYLQNQAWASAKLLFTKCCKEQPSSLSWEGLGISSLHLSELNVAEQALTQANLMNDENAYVWASLAYVCLKKTDEPPGRYYQFRQSLTQAFKLGISEPNILKNIGHEYIRKFFLKGTGPVSQRMDTTEVKIIYQKAKASGASAQSLKEEISKEFEALKEQGNNRLDRQLISSIESAKQGLIDSI